MGLKLYKIWIVLLCGKLSCDAHGAEEQTEVKNPYTEVLEIYDLTSKQDFTEAVLENIVHDFVERIHCNEETLGSGECLDTFCINVSSILHNVDQENPTLITEQTFEQVSVILLHLVIGLNKSCHSEISVGRDGFETYSQGLRNRFTGDNSTEGLQLMSIQRSLELIALDDPHFHNDTTKPHSQSEAPMEEEHHEDELLFNEKCLGADVILDQLGVELDAYMQHEQTGKIAALAVYHILTGAEISRDCRALPREDFFFEELDHLYGNGNNTLGTKGLIKVMDALQIGDTHAQMVAEESGHDHRRKRSAEGDDWVHKKAWETKCYTDEEVLAIFKAHDSDISEEKFSAICPALIQQKLSGVCTQHDEASERISHQPSRTERYGYGTLATIIVCLCSVVGAFVVKFSSDQAYDIIMALFLGLAVGTLFTDAMIHLLPTALGIHGHSEEEGHEHEGEGIVVEDFVWYSLVACAALYFFYLFEKTFTMVRGNHGHSHAVLSDLYDNEINESQADKYTVDKKPNPEKDEDKRNSKKPTPSVAVMVLMGDAVHNFADGVALGAAFSASMALGLSTSIAIFCHELPHELGDFAILLSSGVSFGRALFFNVLVSLTAMIGLYVGLAISDDVAVKQWIVAVAAGLFIYISLVDMMPQLLKSTKHRGRDFLLNNVGILLGAGAMLLLAIFEEKIKVSV